MIIRRMTRGDAEAIHAIHGACLSWTLLGRYTHEQITAWMDGRTPEGYIRASEAGERFFVAEMNASVVGYASWEDDELLSLFVHPDCQSQGVGSGLIEACLADAERMGSAITKVKAVLERRHSTRSMALRRNVGEAQRSEASKFQTQGCTGAPKGYRAALGSTRSQGIPTISRLQLSGDSTWRAGSSQVAFAIECRDFVGLVPI
jgi:GNAT superfamily N-acetyltransferase